MRQFVAPVSPDRNGLLQITGKDFRYFRQILRVKSGDMVAVRLPDGILQNMTVCRIDESGRCIVLQTCGISGSTITRGTEASELESSPSEVEYWLFQFIAKPQKMDMIIRQAAECGVHYIVPIAGEYSQTAYTSRDSWRTDRIDRIIREARQQSGSPVDTQCLMPNTLQEAVKMWDQQKETAAFFLYERVEGTQLMGGVLSKKEGLKKAAIAVGSEGGISPDEAVFLQKNCFIPVHFDTNILRCETAALYGLAVLQNTVMEIKRCQFSE